jgi:hypothetical protein
MNKLDGNGYSNSDGIVDIASTSKRYRGIQNGWFTETASMWPGQKFSLALEVGRQTRMKNERIVSQ